MEFTSLMVDNKWIFERATASRKEDGEGIKRRRMSQARPAYLADDPVGNKKSTGSDNGARIKLAPGLKRKTKSDGDDNDVEMEDAREEKAVMNETQRLEERRNIINNFKKEHEDYEVDFNEDKGELKVRYNRLILLLLNSVLNFNR